MREISIRELWYNFLLKWKLMIAIIICGMSILVGYQLLNRSESSPVQESNKEIFADEELNQIEECYDAYQNYEAAKKYENDTIIMRIDPFHANMVLNEYIITSDNYKDLQSIAYSYFYYASSGAIVTKVSEDEEDLSGLIDATISEVSVSGLPTEEAKTTVTVEVSHENKGQALELSNKIESVFLEYSKELNEKIGKHTIERVMQEAVVRADDKLISWQSQMRSSTVNEKTNYETKRNSLSAAQLAYMEKNYFNKEVEDTSIKQENFVNRISIKMLLLDFIGTVLLVMLCFAILYIIGGKIHSVYSLEETYGLRVLGIIPSFFKGEKSKINRYILSKMYRIKNNEKEETIAATYNNIKYFVNKQNINQIFIEGQDLDHKESIQDIVTLLEKDDISCVLSLDCKSPSERLEQVRKTGNVIFIKLAGKSSHKQLNEEISMCNKNDIKILGILFVV